MVFFWLHFFTGLTAWTVYVAVVLGTCVAVVVAVAVVVGLGVALDTLSGVSAVNGLGVCNDVRLMLLGGLVKDPPKSERLLLGASSDKMSVA